MDNCIFCKIVKGDIPSYQIYSNDRIIAFLDAFPLSEGHVLIIPREHYNTINDLPDDLLVELITEVKKTAVKVCSKLKVTDYNVLCNNGVLSGQSVNHVHFHIIPRTEGDNAVIFKTGEKKQDNYYTDMQKLLKDKL